MPMDGTGFHTARTGGGKVRASAEEVCPSAAAGQHITTDGAA